MNSIQKRHTSILIILIALAALIFAIPQRVSADEPRVTALSAQDKTFNSARIRGRIDPLGSTPTRYWFEWGETDDFGRVTSTEIEVRIDKFDVAQVLTNLNPETRYYYRLVAQTPEGIDYGGTRNFKTESLEDSYVLSRKPQCDDDFDNDNDGLVDMKDPGCKDRKDDSEYTRSGFVTPIAAGIPPKATTLPATVFGNTVILNAQIDLGASAGSQIWFNWGTTPEMEFRTQIRNRGEYPSFNFSETLTNLLPNTTYYFRPMITNIYGASQGAAMTFRTGAIGSTGIIQQVPSTPTSSAPAPTTPSAEQPTPTAGGGNVEIEKGVRNLTAPNGTNDAISAGTSDILEFGIRVTNTSNTTLTDIIVKDVMPESFTFSEGSAGSVYSESSREVAWIIPYLPAGEAVLVSFTAAVEKLDTNTTVTSQARITHGATPKTSNETLVIVNTLPITIAGVESEAPSAPVIGSERNGVSAHTAKTLFAFGGNILPETFWGWGVAALVIVILLFAARFAYKAFRQRGEEEDDIAPFEEGEFENMAEATPTFIQPPAR